MAVPKQIRVATFNVAMNRPTAGGLMQELQEGKSLQIRRVAEIIQRVRPDVILLNEFDFEPTGDSIQLFQEKYLGAGQGGQQPIKYDYSFSTEVNTGLPSGVDLNANGKTDDPNDALGFGNFPGQYGMLVLSKFPIDKKSVRTFQKFLWKDMPGAALPKQPGTDKNYFSDEILKIFRLSSKNHWDVPIRVGDHTLHFLVAHPTPPVFDGPEDCNGLRNLDEIRLWADYIDPSRSEYLVDDNGKKGGLQPNSQFVIAGDMNADPIDGDSSRGAILQLLEHPLIDSSKTPSSEGAVEQSRVSGGVNEHQKGDPAFDTGDFRDDTAGNMRIDYVLPSKNLQVVAAGVFWPKSDEEGFDLVKASDHRLVWIDVRIP